jgi:hypothetical protein
VLVALLVTACTSSADRLTSNPPTVPDTTDGPVTSDGSAVESLLTGSTSPDDEPPGVQPEGFDTTLARATLTDGSVCEFCVWLADSAQDRSRGLMFVSDLGAADAMAFRYPEPHTGTFWMKNTILPLSIAFFAPGGGFLSAFDMEPCTSDPCPNYRTAEGFLVAVEVPQGDLADLGLVAGSTLHLLDLPCTD